MLPPIMRRSLSSTLLTSLLLNLSSLCAIAATLVVAGCDKPQAELKKEEAAQYLKEMEAKDIALQKQRAEAEAAEKAAYDAIAPQLPEKRRPLDKAFSVLWDNLPDAKTLKRKDCPDSQIIANTPDPEKRAILMLTKEGVHLLSGKAKPAVDGGAEEFHTVAAFHAFAMKRASGKESPLLDAAAPSSADAVKAQLEAIEFVMAHRYIGVAIPTAYKEAEVSGVKPSPARIEGWSVIFDRETGKPLCQIEAHGESIALAESASGGALADEEAWFSYINTSSRNFDAITKAFTVEGAPRKKR